MTAPMPELEAAIAAEGERGARICEALHRKGVLPEKWPDYFRVRSAGDKLLSGQLVPAAPEPEGKTLAGLVVSADDTRLFAVGLADLRRAYLVAREADIEPVSAMWMNLSADCERAPEARPVAPVRLDASGAACIAAMKAIQGERLFQASLAALTGIMANPERWKDIAARYEAGTMTYDEASASNARKAVSVGRALLTALEAKP